MNLGRNFKCKDVSQQVYNLTSEIEISCISEIKYIIFTFITLFLFNINSGI